jgi:glyoxylase-like metal-dependent hydrolase (beta-lactamase superfamily II)
MTFKIRQIGGIGYDSNIYFIDCTKPILIDTGTGFHNNDTLEKLNNLKHIDKLSKIILTHNHADHSGGADKISSEYGVKLYANEADGEALVQGNGNITGATMFGFDQPKLEIDFVEDGSTIDCGDLELRVIHTPGHSPGSISLYDEDTKSLICGDLAFMDGGVGRWDLPGGDYKTLVSSYEKVLKLDIENFYPGHGPGNEGDAKKYIEMSYRYLKSCEAFA